MESPPAPTPPTPRQAFTLVELLVVIGIIAVLVGILLPTLNRARRQANDVVCASNMRQIGVAIQNYTVDNKDRLPTTPFSKSFNNGAGKITVQFHGALGNGNYRLGYNTAEAATPSAKELTYGYPALMHRLGYIKTSPGNNSVWLCPAASEADREWGNTYRWYPSTIIREGSSKDRSRYGKTAMLIADNVELKPYLANAYDDNIANNSYTREKQPGQTDLSQFFPHFSKSVLRMQADANGTRYTPWVAPGRGIPFLTTLFVDGHVSKQVARQMTSSPQFGGFAPIAE